MKAKLISGRAALVPTPQGDCTCGKDPSCSITPQASCDPCGDGPSFY